MKKYQHSSEKILRISISVAYLNQVRSKTQFFQGHIDCTIVLCLLPWFYLWFNLCKNWVISKLVFAGNGKIYV